MSFVFAHRGYSNKYPENTMLGFKKAIEVGCDGIELDVQLSKDGEIVVIHDYEVGRTTGAPGLVCDYTAKQLAALNAYDEYEGIFGFTPIPTLREYFDMVKSEKIITNIEIKNTPYPHNGIEEKVADLIREYGLQDRIMISSFNHLALEKIKKLMPQLPTAALIDGYLYKPEAYVKTFGAQYLNINHKLIDQEYVDTLKTNGIEIQAWTADKAEDIERLLSLQVNSIITDEPELARTMRDRK